MGGGHDTIGKHKRHGTDITHQPEMTPAPGKTTGIDLVDKGPLCKQAPTKPGCFLDADSRGYLLQSLLCVLQTAMLNFQTALQNQRVRLLTTAQKSSGSWGFVTEILFGMASHGILGMLTKSANSFLAKASNVAGEGGTLLVGEHDYNLAPYASQIAKVKPTLITGMALTASKGLRTALKNRAHTVGNPGAIAGAKDVDKADFLTIVQNGIGPMVNDLFLSAPTAMTDGEIAAMVAAYSDMTYHSVDAYEADIVGLLDLYDQEQIASIGDGLVIGSDDKSPDGRQHESTRHAVWITCGTKSRLAIVEMFDPRYGENGARHKVNSHDKIVSWSQPEFISWVSEDLLGTAQEFEVDRNNTYATTINATKANTGMPEVDAWAKEL